MPRQLCKGSGKPSDLSPMLKALAQKYRVCPVCGLTFRANVRSEMFNHKEPAPVRKVWKGINIAAVPR